MPTQKKLTFSKVIKCLLLVVPAVFSLTARIGALIGFEARLAAKSLVFIIVMLFVMASLITLTWGCLLTFLALYLLSLQWTLTTVLGLIAALNIVCLILIAYLIKKAQDQLTFPETRRQLRNAMHTDSR